MPQAIAIVVARGGSVRLPGKALLPFGGSTLIGHKVRMLRSCRRISRVVVNTDSDAIAAEAVAHGAELLPGGGRDYDNDTREMIADTCRRIDAPDETVCVWAHPTNPLIRSETYDRAIDEYERLWAANLCDSLCSVTEIQRHAWMQGRALNFNPYGFRHQLASELEPVKVQDGGIFIQTRGCFVARRHFYGRNPVLFTVPPEESCDVDTAQDFKTACALHS